MSMRATFVTEEWMNEQAREVGSLRQQLVNRDRDVERLWGLLRELQWADEGEGHYCSICGSDWRFGHPLACRLRRALEELDPNHGRAPL